MNDDHRDMVVKLYRGRKTVERQACLASYETIKENDFNLNISRYVDTREPEPEIVLNDVASEINDYDEQIARLSAELKKSFDEPGLAYPF